MALGTLLREGGDFDAALAAYQTALQVFDAQPNDAAAMSALQSIGQIHFAQGQYAEALTAYERARELARKLGNRPDEMVVLGGMFTLFLRQDRFRDAMETSRQMIGIGREITEATGDTTFEGVGLMFTMDVLVAQWRCDELFQVGRQALELARGNEAINTEAIVIGHNAVCYHHQRRYDKVLETRRQALEISRKRNDRDLEIMMLDGIGDAYFRQGRYDEALAALQEALQLANELNDRARKASILSSIGYVYAAQERYDKALDMLQQSLQIARDQQNRLNEAYTLIAIGRVYRQQQRYDEALESHKQALQTARAMSFRFVEGVALSEIGEDYEAQQRLSEALDVRLQALELFDSLRTTAGSEAARIGLGDRYVFAYEEPLFLARRLRNDDLAFAISERGRARAFLDSLATGQIELSDDAADALFQRERETALALQRAQDALSQARAQLPADTEVPPDLEAQVAQAEAAYAEAQQAIAQRDDQLAALVPGRTQAPLTRAEAQALLPPDTTLVSYWIGADTGLAFVLTPEQAHTIDLQVTHQEVSQSVRQFNSTLIGAPPTQKVTQPEAGGRLYERLITPLREYVRTSRLIIVPHGWLHYLPFAALGDGSGRVLIDELTLTTLPSASTLRFLLRPPSAPPTTPQSLVLANPDYTLPSAAAEARAIAALFTGQVLSGTLATEQALRKQAPQADIVHFATHGFYDPDAPLASYLALAPTAPVTVTAETRSGVASDLARLEVAEVYGLDLRRADLVVLSACESNLSTANLGDDLVGLTRAFFFAGAPSVIASLWQVSDEATQQLMTRFYTHLRAGASKADALRQAQQDVRRYLDAAGNQPYASPYYWAGFVLVGEGVGEGAGALVAVPWWQRLPWWGWAAPGLITAGTIAGWIVRRRLRTLSLDNGSQATIVCADRTLTTLAPGGGGSLCNVADNTLVFAGGDVSVVRSAGDTAIPRVIAPRGTGTLSTTPTLRWTPVEGAESYMVE